MMQTHAFWSKLRAGKERDVHRRSLTRHSAALIIAGKVAPTEPAAVALEAGTEEEMALDVL